MRCTASARRSRCARVYVQDVRRERSAARAEAERKSESRIRAAMRIKASGGAKEAFIHEAASRSRSAPCATQACEWRLQHFPAQPRRQHM